MANKKDIQNLLNGIMGKPQGEASPEEKESLGITPEMEEQLNQVRRERVGRPKGTEPRGARRKNKSQEARATFIIGTDTLRKLKYVSLIEGRLLKDIMDEALGEYLGKWESENGTINLPKAK